MVSMLEVIGSKPSPSDAGDNGSHRAVLACYSAWHGCGVLAGVHLLTYRRRRASGRDHGLSVEPQGGWRRLDGGRGSPTASRLSSATGRMAIRSWWRISSFLEQPPLPT